MEWVAELDLGVREEVVQLFEVEWVAELDLGVRE